MRRAFVLAIAWMAVGITATLIGGLWWVDVEKTYKDSGGGVSADYKLKEEKAFRFEDPRSVLAFFGLTLSVISIIVTLRQGGCRYDNTGPTESP